MVAFVKGQYCFNGLMGENVLARPRIDVLEYVTFCLGSMRGARKHVIRGFTHFDLVDIPGLIPSI
jgi:hypothetical protein